MSTFSIIIPTVGRSTLLDTLESLVDAGIGAMDEVILVVDGSDSSPEAILAVEVSLIEALVPVRMHVFGEQQGDWGQPGRNMGVRLAAKEWLVFTQDDSVLVRGALSQVRRDVAGAPGSPHLYRVVPNCGLPVPVVRIAPPSNASRVLGQKLPRGTIDGDCLVVHRSHAGVWGTGYEGDYDWIETALATYPRGWEGVIYHPATILSTHQRFRGRDVPAQEVAP